MSSIELPNEVWVEILSHLPYGELKKCERVSKTFQTFIHNAPTLKTTVFRTRRVLGPGEEVAVVAADDVELHPVFEKIMYGCYTSIINMELFDMQWHDRNPPLLLKDTAAVEENATEPPVSVLRLGIHDWEPDEVRGTDGAAVTVKQVMETLCGLWEEDGCPSEGYEGGDKGWNGWGLLKLDKERRLVMYAHTFPN